MARPTRSWMCAASIILVATVDVPAAAEDGGTAPDAGAVVTGAAAYALLLPGVDAGNAHLPPLEALFAFPLTDDAAVAARAAELRSRLQTRREELARLQKKKATADRTKLVEEVESLQAELDVLDLPLETRGALVAQEQEAREEERRREERMLLAEQQRQLAAAAAAALATERRVLEDIRQRLEAVAAEQQQHKTTLEERRLAAARKRQEPDERMTPLVAAATRVQRGAEADRLYDELVLLLVELRLDIKHRLDGLEQLVPIPWGRDVVVPQQTLAELEPERQGLLQQQRELRLQSRALDATQHQVAWQELANAFASERQLNNARVDLLDRVSPDKRDRTLGLGEEGLAQFERELRHFWLLARWFGVSWRQQASDLVEAPNSLRGVGSLLFELVAIGVLVFFARRLRDARAALNNLAESTTERLVRSPGARRAWLLAIAAVDSVFPEALALAVLLTSGWLLGPRVSRGVLSVAFAFAVSLGGYRLLRRAAHSLLAWVAESRDGGLSLELSERRRAKIWQSITAVGRFGFGLFIVMAGVQAAVGRGYLFHLAVRAAWISGVVAGIYLLRKWRAEIGAAYLFMRPKGMLSEMVRETRPQWYGLLVALAAFGALVLTAVLQRAQQFLMGFDRTKRTQAYLLRRRLEQQAASAPAQPQAGQPVPPVVLDALTPEALPYGSPLLIQRFPGLEQVRAQYETWKQRGGVGATVLVGKTGYGKTTWLQHCAATLDPGTPTLALNLEARATSALEVRRRLSQLVGLASDAALEETLSGTRRIVIIDNLEQWHGRWPGGMEAWEELSGVIRRARATFWVCSVGHYPFEFVRWAKGDNLVFQHRVHLPAWKEHEISELLARRMRECGFSLAYQAMGQDGSEAQVQGLPGTVRNYNRIVWDYAEGSPRSALRAWQSSMVLGEQPNTVGVRLFQTPDAAYLDALDESTRFVLAGIVWQAQASAGDLERSLRLPPASVEDALHRLCGKEVVVSGNGRFWIAVAWWPAVIRFLKRRHLVDS